MIHDEPYESGNLYGIRYRFEEAGESIPEHRHPPNLAHNIVVLEGSVAFDSQGEHKVLGPGVFDFDGTIPHTITALGPAVILNLNLHGKS